MAEAFFFLLISCFRRVALPWPKGLSRAKVWSTGVILHEMRPMVDEFDTCLDMGLDQGSLNKIVESG